MLQRWADLERLREKKCQSYETCCEVIVQIYIVEMKAENGVVTDR